MTSRTNIIIAVVVGIGALVGAYLLFFNTNANSSAITTSGAPASAAEVTFLNLASLASPISFDTSILTDARFTGLVDIHTAIVPDAQGRKDPFAPVPGITTTGQ